MIEREYKTIRYTVSCEAVLRWALTAGFGLVIGGIAGGVLCYAVGMIAKGFVTGGF